MWLLIDAGNTRIKWALVETRSASQLGGWSQFDTLTHEEFAQRPSVWTGHKLERIVISNVAGAAVKTQLTEALQSQQVSIEWFASEVKLAGLVNRYKNPGQLGSDRFATAIAAHALYPNQNLIVATCGTATTIDAVTAQGEFIGGMIAPGLLLMAQSLAQKTAQLPELQQTSAEAMTAQFADHTQGAIIAGCLAAQAGAIEYAIRNFSQMAQLDLQEQPLCLLSGGAAKYIAPNLKLPHQLIDHLVLIGLQVVALC